MDLVANKPALFSRGTFSKGAARACVFFRKHASPFRAFYHSRRAISLFCKGEYGRAISHCDRALLLNPGNPLAYLVRGACHYAAKNKPSAISDLKKAIESNNRPGGPMIPELDRDALRWLEGADGLP